MQRRWIVPVTFVIGTVVGGLGLTLASADIAGNTVNACIGKTSFVGRIRPTVDCDPATETQVQWNVTGPQGLPGKDGSPDTPQQVLDKIVQVDGQGSGLDSSFLDGIDSTGFLRTTGKAADADKLDGLNSSVFAKRGPSGTGTIGLSAIAANSCRDVVFGISGLQTTDSIVLNVLSGDSLPARLTMMPLDVPTAGQLNVRICNGTSTASLADSDIKIRWTSMRP